MWSEYDNKWAGYNRTTATKHADMARLSRECHNGQVQSQPAYSGDGYSS
jgi:hypothetical protein